MTTYRTVDIMAELEDILNKEEMVASFDFLFTPGGGESIEGLCTISAPRAGKSKVSYVSIVFVIDLPDPGLWQVVDDAMNNIDWDSFSILSDEMSSVLSNPPRRLRANSYLKEVSLYLTTLERPGKDYCSETLLPLITKVTGVKPGSLTFWEHPVQG
jgi:hypothetical protein